MPVEDRPPLPPPASPATWSELHQHPAPTAAWLADFAARIGDCPACRVHWIAWVADHPAPLDLPDYRRWTVAAHNAVNARLGREPWSYRIAAERWGW